jgi:hypothetical protein
MTHRALERQLRAAEQEAGRLRQRLTTLETQARELRVRHAGDDLHLDAISTEVITARVALRLAERDVTVARERLEAA